jgi:hypothetical protein
MATAVLRCGHACSRLAAYAGVPARAWRIRKACRQPLLAFFRLLADEVYLGTSLGGRLHGSLPSNGRAIPTDSRV